MDDEFGAGYSRVLSSSLVLAGVGGRTADQALSAGVRAEVTEKAQGQIRLASRI